MASGYREHKVSSDSKIAIITNILPQYREDMYKRLIEKYGERLHVFCQSEMPGMNIKSVHERFSGNVSLVKYLSLKKEKLCWQFIPLLRIIKDYKIIFVYGNPRVVSNVFYSFLFRLMGKKVVIWGQYHTASSGSLLKRIRLKWWGFFDYVFLYTDKEAEAYKDTNRAVMVTGMNNGLNQDEIKQVSKGFTTERLIEWRHEHGLDNKRLILSCARLEKKNQFELIIACLPSLIVKYPDLLWCVIGDGDDKRNLQRRAKEAGVTNHIKWLGAVYGQESLAPWFLISECLVHPGAIGLSLMHAMGYGLPVITHDNNDKQMPEVAALDNGFNGLTYIEGNTESLCNSISGFLSDSDMRAQLSSNALQTVANNYNTETMANKFVSMVNKIQEVI